MGYDPVHPDTLAQHSHYSAVSDITPLTCRELDGIVASLAVWTLPTNQVIHILSTKSSLENIFRLLYQNHLLNFAAAATSAA